MLEGQAKRVHKQKKNQCDVYKQNALQRYKASIALTGEDPSTKGLEVGIEACCGSATSGVTVVACSLSIVAQLANKQDTSTIFRVRTIENPTGWIVVVLVTAPLTAFSPYRLM